MAIERTAEGLEVRLRPHGAGRFFGGGFLLFWLCGWAVGETIVLWLLVMGAYSLLTGKPPGPGREPLAFGPTLAVGAFLLFWLSLWTVGGIAALFELLRLVWGEDRILAHHDGIVITRKRGPFRSKQRIARDRLSRIHVLARTGMLMAETDKRIDLSSLGRLDERNEAASALCTELKLGEGEPGVAIAELPEGWQEVVTPEGDRALVTDVETRRKQARFATIVAFGVGVVATVLIWESLREPSLAALAIIACTLAAGLTWGATWLTRGRMEWIIRSGSVVLRRRFGSGLREIFEARQLDLKVSSDSDGDDWFSLEVVASPSMGDHHGKLKNRRIVRTMNDPVVPRRLGAWLARNAQLSFEDQSKDDARAAEMERLRAELPRMGRLGRLAARLIDRSEQGRPKS